MTNGLDITNKSKLLACLIEPLSDGELNLPDGDILALKFTEDIEKSKNILKNILSKIDKSRMIMICGCGADDIDRILLPELIKCLDRQCIISYVTEKTYKDVIPCVIKGEHYVVLKTPIDINLTKELNILCTDLGLSINKILMNTDIGGLGYGYEYGYSIMEKVRIEGNKGDEYLNLPLVSEAGLESLKTKEAKFGNKKRSLMIELVAVIGALAAGANIVIVKNSENINVIRGLL